MRLPALTLSVLTLLVAGCAAPSPDVATAPHATLVGSHVDPHEPFGTNRIDTFRVLSIDGRNALPVTDQPSRLIGHDATDLVPAGRPVRVEVEGFGFYENTARRLFWDSMRAAGTITFVPVAGATYSVRGTVAPEASSVWIEDDATHAPVGDRITVPGRNAPPPADAAAASR